MSNVWSKVRYLCKRANGLLTVLKSYLTAEVYKCNICNYKGQFIPYGVKARPNALCPSCGSLERHRYFILCTTDYLASLSPNSIVVHSSPEYCLSSYIKAKYSFNYYSAFYQPGLKDSMDITRMHFADQTVEVLIAHHVLQSVPDYLQAIREISRVLKPGGRAFLSFPMCSLNSQTYTGAHSTSNATKERARTNWAVDNVHRLGSDIFQHFLNADLQLVSLPDIHPSILTAHSVSNNAKVYLFVRL